MTSAGRTSASARAKLMPSSRWRRRRVVHHRNSDFDGFSLRRLDDIHSDTCSMQLFNLSAEQLDELSVLICRNRKVFAKDLSELPVTHLAGHTIETFCVPVCQRAYCYSPEFYGPDAIVPTDVIRSRASSSIPCGGRFR